MKAIITSFFLLVGFSCFAQYRADTLVNGKIPLTIYIPPNTSFPFEATVMNRQAVIMTMNQARAISMYAGKTSKVDSINVVSEDGNKILLQKIEELEDKVSTTETSLEAALFAYEAEKMKNEGLESANAIKDDVIKAQRKEIRRQKAIKWALAVGGVAVTILAIIR